MGEVSQIDFVFAQIVQFRSALSTGDSPDSFLTTAKVGSSRFALCHGGVLDEVGCKREISNKWAK